MITNDFFVEWINKENTKRKLPKTTNLDLSDNLINNVDDLLAVLQPCEVLTELNLSCNLINTDGLRKLVPFLQSMSLLSICNIAINPSTIYDYATDSKAVFETSDFLLNRTKTKVIFISMFHLIPRNWAGFLCGWNLSDNENNFVEVEKVVDVHFEYYGSEVFAGETKFCNVEPDKFHEAQEQLQNHGLLSKILEEVKEFKVPGLMAFELGFRFLAGKSVKENLISASYWFSRASNVGYSEAVDWLEFVAFKNRSKPVIKSTTSPFEEFKELTSAEMSALFQRIASFADSAPDIEHKIQKLHKKIDEVHRLIERRERGDKLNIKEREKIDKLTEFENSLKSLQSV